MMKTHQPRIATVLILISLAGCGSGPVFFVPEDCITFTRGEVRDWFDNAQDRREDGAGEVEAFSAVLAECVAGNCDGQSGGVCAVACTACTDALITNVYGAE
jgi:hypothetical protein